MLTRLLRVIFLLSVSTFSTLAFPAARTVNDCITVTLQGFQDPAHSEVVFPNESVEIKTGNAKITFERTNRGLKDLEQQGIIPENFIILSKFENKRVLDLGTGNGKLVKELRGAGAQADGLDIVLRPQEKALPYFIEADARKIPVANNEYDFIFSNLSIFSSYYGYEATDSFLIECLRELKRVLKKNGTAYLGGTDEKRMTALLKEVPGLKAKFTQLNWGSFLELQK